ncbi:MAG: hypothetical protein GWP18_00740 [Proteobacteria bacterium]|nr:hypothetical protein [Pseudomonadota bacterium]
MKKIATILASASMAATFVTILPATAVAQETPASQPTQIVAVGGTNAVPTATLSHLNVCATGATRLSGGNRYATGRAALSMESVAGGTVYVAQGRTFADALPAGAAANADSSALVLVERDSVPPPSERSLNEIAPDKIVIVGGPAVINDSVEATLRDSYGDVVRIAGANRYETAIALSQFQFPDGKPGPDAVIIATGEGFIDALASAPLAGYKNAPLLLVPNSGVPPSLAREIQRLAPSEIFLIGGTAVVSTSIADEIAAALPTAELIRIAGQNRFDTAKKIASYLPPSPDRVIAVTGYDFPDALVAGSVARSNPLVLIDRKGLNNTSASTISTATGKACKPITKISSFTTYYTAGQSRVINIQLIADQADNAIVLPDDTFSLNGYVGNRTVEKGYVAAGAIIGGKLVCCDHPVNIGGGVSQFTTTLYNAIFYGGLEDVTHRPHSIYFSRYPLGIEATLAYTGIDLEFRNDTDWPVQIDASYTSRSVTVDLWGWNDQRTVDAQVIGSATTADGGKVKIIRTITYQNGTKSVQSWWHTYNGVQSTPPEPTPPPPSPEPTPPPPPPPPGGGPA